MTIKSAAVAARTAFVVLACVTCLGAAGQQHSEAAEHSPQVAHQPAPNPLAAANGKHLLAYVVTASDCGWSRLPTAMASFRNLRSALRKAHGKNYAQVTVVAVDIDENADTGVRFLAELAGGSSSSAFDQVIVGGSWLNEQIVRFVWRDKVAKASIPQVILVERLLDTSAFPRSIEVAGDRVIATFSGEREIVSWVDRGVPIP